MSKSKVVTIIVSLGIIIALGVGGYFIYSKNKTPINDTAKVEDKDKSSSDKSEKNNKENTPENKDKEPNVSHENNGGGPTENNDTAKSNENTNDGPAGESNPSKTPNVTPVPPQNGGGNSGDTNNVPETPNNPSAPSDNNFIAQIEQLIFERVNFERVAAGLPEISYNTTMEKYARIKSADMANKGYFSHEDPQGKLITDNMKADGVSYNAWGENIAYIQGQNGNELLAKEFMNNWMNSSGHRANILSTNFTSIGVGVYKIGNTYYATQEFYR